MSHVVEIAQATDSFKELDKMAKAGGKPYDRMMVWVTGTATKDTPDGAADSMQLNFLFESSKENYIVKDIFEFTGFPSVGAEAQGFALDFYNQVRKYLPQLFK
tara:strand:+ start:56753 stop:57061 length:309 start_codon:yes stop_codon:yes gene_type:complete